MEVSNVLEDEMSKTTYLPAAVCIMATRWGIISAGAISNDFVMALQLLSKDEHEVVAVAARSLQNAEEFAAKYSIKKAYGSYSELAKDPNVGECVCVCVCEISRLS